MGLKFNKEKCIGCKLCELACSGKHEGKFDVNLARLKVDSSYKDKEMIIKGKVCILCGKCVDACPVSAITMKDGKLSYDKEGCINCGICVKVCPEEVIVQKEDSIALCDLCEGDPWCVKCCPHGALVYEEGV